ncbi:hypothetical protein K443DRAFT_673013 [Laccaria amethystina LaAM-08-1]|uniref:Uncharacterized protein n=1 Tax=Laccaria amethystina LaAM-08-1 TaxID=1095629 RepID=A0A0C9YI68_9AGAR|nr:hypothetical protein K443DRAFT_673013 [Laccaria amethystina LaAM-08-1]
MLAPPPYVDSSKFPSNEEADKLEGGRCWKKAFTGPILGNGLTWMTINHMRTVAMVCKVSGAYFTVKIVRPGFIHMEETEDETEWTLEDILKLPGGYRVGGLGWAKNKAGQEKNLDLPD